MREGYHWEGMGSMGEEGVALGRMCSTGEGGITLKANIGERN